MNEILSEIREYIKNGYFKNEENVRFSLVARIIQELGWNIWNPKEVATEFPVLPNEDSTRVDIALFDNSTTPSVFIEIKALGKLETELAKYEVQLRDYNRNNTAPFSIITDGCKLRFYYSQTGGEFSNKCFKILNLINDDFEDIELSLNAFLSKEEIQSGNAKIEAETYLKLTQKQRAMEDALPQASRLVLEPPYPTLINVIIKLVNDAGIEVTENEVSQFLVGQKGKKPPKKELIPPLIPPFPSPIKRLKTPTPPCIDWVNKVPELRSIPNLRTWKSVCDYLGIDVGGDSARRKLKKWVPDNRPEWPQIQEPK